MGRSGNELVFRSAQLGASLIHRLGDAVWGVAGQIFFKSVAKKATAGPFGFASQALGPFEDLFRNRDGRFHTRSITPLLSQWQAGGRARRASKCGVNPGTLYAWIRRQDLASGGKPWRWPDGVAESGIHDARDARPRIGERHADLTHRRRDDASP